MSYISGVKSNGWNCSSSSATERSFKLDLDLVDVAGASSKSRLLKKKYGRRRFIASSLKKTLPCWSADVLHRESTAVRGYEIAAVLCKPGAKQFEVTKNFGISPTQVCGLFKNDKEIQEFGRFGVDSVFKGKRS